VLPKLIEQLKTYSLFARYGNLPDHHKQYLSVLEIDTDTLEVKELLSTNEAVRGVSSAILIGNELFLGSWVDKSLAVCSRK
jgi:hypothetical protein